MEPWQKDCIQTYLVDLIDNTSVNARMIAFLKAENVFHKVDVELLESLSQSSGNTTAAAKLFDMIVSRTNSYKVIGKAAFKCAQSGLFVILLKGLVKHLLGKCNITPKEETLDRILKTNCEREDTLNFFLSKIDKTTLFEESWIPPPRDGTYIPRYISNVVKLDPGIFKKECRDIFVFTGVSRSELSKLVSPYSTASSRDVLLQKNKRSRYLLLEHQHDWNKLKLALLEANKSSTKRPVHLIRFDGISGNYILQNSTETIEHFSQHVLPRMGDKSLYFSENQFVGQMKEFKKQHAICICDIPGMGKTWILEKAAREIQNQSPNRLVAFVSLSKFVQHVMSASGNGEIDDLALMRYLCSFDLTSLILHETLLDEKMELELFLDGYDEVPDEHLESTKRFFRDILTYYKNIRMFVTSRPHMKLELQRALGAIPYDILPFSIDNQVDYLVKFWKASFRKRGPFQEARLTTFALASLEKLKKSLTKEQMDFMGIPLQCFLLASVNLSIAELYCFDQTFDFNIDECIPPTSMNDMYSKYLEMGINKATGNDKRSEWTRGCSEGSFLNMEEKNKLKTFHVWKALQLLFPELAEDYFTSQNLSERNPSSQHLACGLLQITSMNEDGLNDVTFLHRTFAEYLVAEFFVEIITGKYPIAKDDTIKVFGNVLVSVVLGADIDEDDENFIKTASYKDIVRFETFKFKSPALSSFVNASLEIHTLNSIPQKIATAIVNSVEGETFCPIISASIRSNNVNIIRFINAVFCRAFEQQTTDCHDEIRKLLSYSDHLSMYTTYNLPNEDHYWSSFAYLYFAAIWSTVAIVEELYTLFMDCLGENLNHICAAIPNEVRTPLHQAIRHVDYSLVELFADRISLKDRRLLHSTVEYTRVYMPDDVKTTIECCRLLMGKCDSFLHESSNAIFAWGGVHVELVKFLIQVGDGIADIQQNLVTWHSDWMYENQFIELCRFLIFDVKATHLFRPNLPYWNDPLPIIIHKIDTTTLQNILQLPGVNLNGCRRDGNNLVLSAICRKGHLEVIQLLIKLGVDIRQTNDKGQGALHLVAEEGDIKYAEFLISNNLIPLEDQDNNGNTALHLASRRLDMMEYLVSQNANTLAINNDGNTIAHLVATLHPSVKEINIELVDFLVSLKSARRLFTKRNVEGKTPVNLLTRYRNFDQVKDLEFFLRLPECDLTKNEIALNNTFLSAIKTRRSVEVLQLLIEKGANPFLTNERKQTALHLAAEVGNLEITKFLVSRGIPLDCRDKDEETPLLLSTKNLEVAKYLILKNADAFALSDIGNTIAHQFAGVLKFSSGTFKHEDYQSLLKRKNIAGRTPLHEWISRSTPLNSLIINQIMKLSGINADTEDEDGQTMFLTAVAQNYHVEVVNCLLLLHSVPLKVNNFGANTAHVTADAAVNHQDNEGNTALHLSARNRNLALLKFLISKNANVLVRNRKGENVAHAFIDQIGPKFHNSKTALLTLMKLPEGTKLYRMVDGKGQSPLHKWISENEYFDSTIGSLESLTFEKLLAKSEVDVNKADLEGNTMLLSAAKTHVLWIVECLHKHGAYQNAINNEGNNAIHLAVSCKQSKDMLAMLKLLCSIGCHAHIKNNDGCTPLELALLFQQETHQFEELKCVLENA